MNLNASMQAVKDLFRFPFRDPRWQNKLLIGSLLGLAGTIFPIIPTLPLMGYMARLLRDGAHNADPERLPEWDNWEELFVDGLRQTGVTLILMLPGMLAMAVGWGLYMGTVFAMPGIEGRGSDSTAFFAVMGGLAVFFVSMAVGMLLLAAGGLLLPPAMAHVAERRSFSAFFRVGEWWAILRANFGSFLVAWAIFGLIYLVMMLVVQVLYMSVVFCLLIPFAIIPLGVYSAWVMYRLVGQAYGEAQSKTAPEPAPAA